MRQSRPAAYHTGYRAGGCGVAVVVPAGEHGYTRGLLEIAVAQRQSHYYRREIEAGVHGVARVIFVFKSKAHLSPLFFAFSVTVRDFFAFVQHEINAVHGFDGVAARKLHYKPICFTQKFVYVLHVKRRSAQHRVIGGVFHSHSVAYRRNPPLASFVCVNGVAGSGHSENLALDLRVYRRPLRIVLLLTAHRR